MLRILFSTICSIFIAKFCAVLYSEFQGDIFEILGYSKKYFYGSEYYPDVPEFFTLPICNLLVFIIVAIPVFLLFFKCIFKNIPTLKSVLMKLVSDSKDVIKAQHRDDK